MSCDYLSQEEINVLLGGDELQIMEYYKNNANKHENYENMEEKITCLNDEKEYQLADNSVLLVLSDSKRYYFDKVYARICGKDFVGTMQPHVGMIQDSCIITVHVDEGTEVLEENYVDIRYFPHFQHLEMYVWSVGKLSVYLENSGKKLIYVTTPVGVIQLEPGKCVLVDRENVIKCEDDLMLSKSDLYPALI